METVGLGRWRFVGIAIIAFALAAIVLLLVGQGPIVADGPWVFEVPLDAR
jgi:hypothetical protein